MKYLTPPLSDRKRMALAAGGLFSTAGDLSRIYRMILNGGELDGKRYLKAETLKQMTTNQTGDMKVSFSDGMHMGLGFHLVNEPQGVTAALSSGSFGHGGAYGTQAWMDPTRGLGIVLLIQRANCPTPTSQTCGRRCRKRQWRCTGRPRVRQKTGRRKIEDLRNEQAVRGGECDHGRDAY